MAAMNADKPVFSAVSSSARQLFILLRCISFGPKTHVDISPLGIRFSVEDSSVMEGHAFLDASLFTTFTYTPPVTSSPSSSPSSDPTPAFQISLPALLETLQIFGITDSRDKWSSRESAYSSITRAGGNPAFDQRVLGMTGLCRLSYDGPGAPFCVRLEEAGVSTTCELSTYEAASGEDIPFDRDALVLKTILRAPWLHDAIAELSSTTPSTLTIHSSPSVPYFALSATGPLGSATVAFSRDTPQLLETFHAPRTARNAYKFALVRAASRAMAVASKVSVRIDCQGVLSLQFMLEVEGGGVSFVDFRFVPFAAGEGEADDSDGGEARLGEAGGGGSEGGGAD
ncbi:hypothetical protein B0A49_11049 [Cryomyces minteri]|uniref:Cell cycle checkpoint protein RAD1 n=1 Tax=Cryomyces minteri TaxID=331657 RepID=A0A4U0WGQ9_9PEZI|nr:hypothetical protein B0A49_11049 [Cryomyces minteri]